MGGLGQKNEHLYTQRGNFIAILKSLALFILGRVGEAERDAVKFQ